MAPPVEVVGGVDPHADTIHVAAVTAVGKVLGDAEFPTTPAGYADAVAFLVGYGPVVRVGVEGAAGYGSGVSRALQAAGIAVLEVERPTRSARRRKGKSDRLDAYHAARAVLAERSWPSGPARSRTPPSMGCGRWWWPVSSQGQDRGDASDQNDPGQHRS